MVRNLTIILLLSLIGCGNSKPECSGQNIDSLIVAMTADMPYDFIDLAGDTLMLNGSHFPRELFDEIPVSDFGRVSVVHYGDSHINAGHLGRTVRMGLQGRFGNAGLGLVTPYRLAGGYEPPYYSITSDSRWLTSKVTDRAPGFDVGVSGYSLRMPSAASRGGFTISVKDEDAVAGLTPQRLSYSFDRMTVIHDSLAPMITVVPFDRMASFADGVYGGEDVWSPYVTHLDLMGRTSQVDLLSYNAGRYGGDGGFSGVLLENGHRGVLYSAIGVGGACSMHWTRADNALRQSSALQADVIIVSLGSNEAAGYNFIDAVFEQQVDNLICGLRKYNPDAMFILTTPIQVYGRKSRRGAMIPNANYSRVRDVLLRYGQEHNIAIFDMYSVAGCGGEVPGAQIWQQCGMLRSDKLHFTEHGYQLQGLLLLNAILKEFDK